MEEEQKTSEEQDKGLGIDRSVESGWAAEPEVPAESPAEQGTQKSLERPSAEEIYKQVARNAESELKRTSLSLAISGVTGGMFMGLSALGVGLVVALLGASPHSFVISRMFYPLGFIVVILGRSQLFTENTLYPVALVLAEKKQLWNTMRLWAIVLPSNVVGALIFAALISLTPALPGPILHAVAGLGVTAAQMPPGTVFWSGVMAGWIIATTAWLVSGSHSITGSVMLIWALTFVVGLGGFAHCIATSGEILTAVLTRQIGWVAYPHWLWVAVAGNVCGGVFMVTLLEYGQSMAGLNLEQETLDDLGEGKAAK
jgi:formate/nitrite transporter FocA (FNT family)